MKLLTHTSLFMVTMSMILFFSCGVAFYFVFKQYSVNQLEMELRHDMEAVRQDPGLFLAAIDAKIPFFDRLEYSIPEKDFVNQVRFFDSLLFLGPEKAYIPVRYIQFYDWVGDTALEFRIYKSRISSDDLTERIGVLITLMAVLFALGIYILNRHVFSRTWKGFYLALKKAQIFKAGDPVPRFDEDEIDEFEELNETLSKMTARIEKDYLNLKSFTSHATHEFQTPLAVIMSKADLLLQNENYSEEQYKQIQAIQQYARQLSRLTQALSLLFKIDNQQYKEVQEIRVNDLIHKHLDLMKEQCEMRDLQLIVHTESDSVLQMNQDLADILFLNLFRNAVNHNVPGGSVRVQTSENLLQISNPGGSEALDVDRLYKEFEKGKESSGLGLGLAIVLKIVQIYHYEISYRFENQTHIFSLIFQVRI